MKLHSNFWDWLLRKIFWDLSQLLHILLFKNTLHIHIIFVESFKNKLRTSMFLYLYFSIISKNKNIHYKTTLYL